MNDIFVVPCINSDQLCIIDSIDAKLVMKHRWYRRKDGYCMATSSHILLHKLVQKFSGQCDHKNRLKFDNRGCNLRPGNRMMNKHNCFLKRFKGVYQMSSHHRKKRWNAYITYRRRRYNLGYFMTVQEAAIAYNMAALAYYEGDATLNHVFTK